MSSKNNHGQTEGSESNQAAATSDGAVVSVSSKSIVESGEADEKTVLRIWKDCVDMQIRLENEEAAEVGKELLEQVND
jgi:hypothetical protein